MEVLNKKERAYSFLLFLLVFFLTVGIILLAVFFDYQIPRKELSHLRDENRKMAEEFQIQEQFAFKLEELKSYTDSLNVKGEDFYFNQQSAINTIIAMQYIIPNRDSLELKRDNMYDNILLAYRQLINAKKTINTLGASKEEIDLLLQQLETYKSELEIVKRDLEVCRQINRAR